jgi:hypothetical protein
VIDAAGRLTVLEARVSELERAADRRQAASAAGNTARAEAVRLRRQRVAAHAVALGWQDASRSVTNGGIIGIICGLLADANGRWPSGSTIRSDIIAALGRGRSEDWTAEQRAASALRRRTLRTAAE